MDRASKGMMDWFDKHEGREEGSSFRGINKERVRQGYKAHKDPSKSKSKALSKMKNNVDRPQVHKNMD